MINNATTIESNIILTDENMNAIKQAMKIGFYKSFYNKGIINATQFEKLMQISNKKSR